MSDEAISDHSSDPDFQPIRSLANNLTLPINRKTRNPTKNSRRSKSLGRAETLGTEKDLVNQSDRLVSSTENILNTTSKLLDECGSILDTTNPLIVALDQSENNEQGGKPIPKKRTIEWSEIKYYNCPSKSRLLH